ncbi:hypothetical protein EZ428_21240 [Pedobacter frigiditerrae]|uniref:Uncharacterized protein n=1 Tax=Pedobacter frigiditerrae TaxID=2530452 RepID=A0A4R0MNA2_9SPHI|nr:hypothetical protein [Pedobacter frigiditerrae]TCC88248.1 hypothetical protein EZ428_21240 [Pedobacter frigiditerrae]
MKKILFLLAFTGWAIALLVHILSIFEIYFSDTFPIEDWLFPGLFVVWIATIFYLKSEKELKSENAIANNEDNYFSPMFDNIPNWLRVLAIFSFIYSPINFFMTANGYTPEIDNGQFILMEKSTFIKTLTKLEYIHYKANEVRLSTGHLLAFYGISSAFLYRNMKMGLKGYT